MATGPAFSPYGDGSVGWMITQYDVYGRVTQTGWKQMTVDQNERSNMQTIINTGNNPFTLTASEVLSKNFYDNYDFSGAPSNLPSLIENQTRATNVKGLPTGSWVKVLDNASSSTTEVSYTLYDYKYRPVHTKTTNHLGGYTQIDTHLDWAGKTLYTQTKHKRIADDTEIVVKDIFQYNLQDKLVVHKQQINQLPEQLITKNTYDELGQLISKNVGGSDITGATGLQKVDYSYNIRGWLKQINNVTNMETDNDLFAFKINYNDTETATPLFNGNISETFWKTTTDNIQRKYKYTYDNLNRLLKADYSKEGNTEFNSYLEHLSYDKNGNIKSLVRNGAMDTDGMQFENPIDNLTYLYDDTNKNQLLRVFDSTANPQGFSDDSDGISDTEDDYAYDDNGNMTHDDNKGITHITYNHLNLPVEIIFGTYGKIAYLYTATGQKLKKTVTEGTTITTTDYLSGFQYKNLVLQFFPHAEGYVNATEEMVVMGGTSYRFNYVFNYTDHLGNIRLSYSLDPSTKVLKIIEENHYYPFGLKHSGYNSDKMMYTKEAEVLKIKPVPPLFITSYKYKYNGKEYQDELGLNVTAMDFRMYDNAIGRFHNIDKMTDIMPSLSPYRFAFNNPVLWGDPTGLLESGGGDDEEYFLQGQEVVITPDSVASEPASFNYSLIPSHIMNDPRRPTLEQYNKHNGTNYQSFKEYYNAEYYQPARKKMMQERNQAGRTVVGTLTVLATAGVGTAYALPVLVSCSPAIQSTVATLVTNPSVQQIGLNVGSQLWVNGGDINKVNIVEGLMSGISGAGAVSLGELVNINVNSIKSGDFIEKPSFGKTSVGVVGGLASYGYGEATDTFLKGTGTKGKIIGTYFKFLVESATNAAPNLVPNEN